MFSIRFLGALIVLVIATSSCAVQQKIPFYLQNAADSTIISDSVPVAELKIQPNDVIAIEIASKSMQPEKSDQMFNAPQAGGSGGGVGINSPTFGYLVDKDGDIIHHRLGKIHAGGLTRSQLAEEIRRRIVYPVELLTDPTVKVRFLNFRVNVLGQVAREGTVTVNSERMTIVEAISLAGGITDFGRRDYVRVIREQDGKRTVGNIDLTKADFYRSPYYHLAQNDVVLVEPNKFRYQDIGQNRINQRIGLLLPITTIALTLISIFAN
jgi:polysaccharide export outer membrane protein